MPHEIEEHNFGRLTRSPKYDEFLDGKIYVWTEDELAEYGNGAISLRGSLYSAANRRDLKIRSQIREDGSLVVQAYDPEEV